MNMKKSIKKPFKRKEPSKGLMITNLYHTDYNKNVLISYIISPFFCPNNFKHQNYLTSHLVAESFSSLGYNMDIVEYNDQGYEPDYNRYAIIFGMGYQFER